MTRLSNYNYVNTLPLFTNYTQPITDDVICTAYSFTDDEFALIKHQVEEAEARNTSIEKEEANGNSN